MNSEEFLIGELAEKAGVSVRTIRYYVSEGLLPSPEIRGRYTVYDEDYLNRIRLIKRLKDAFLPIKEIRLMLETKTTSEIEEFLSHYEANRTPSNDALSYIARLMDEEPGSVIRESRMPPAQPQIQMNRNIAPKQYELIDDVNGISFRKFIIRPGVEIHIADYIYLKKRDLVIRMVTAIKDLFRKDEPRNT